MSASAHTRDLGKEITADLLRLITGFVGIVAAVVVFVLVVRVSPASDNVYAVATILIIAGALAVGTELTYLWNRPIIAWALSLTVVPSYIYFAGLLIPSPPNKYELIAYIFGTFYGVIAGTVGVLIGIYLRRRKQRAS